MNTTDAAARDWLWNQLSSVGQLAADWGPSLLLGIILTLICTAGIAIGWGLGRSRVR